MTFGPSGQAGLYRDIAGMDQTTADAIVKRCLDAGVNFFDTADVYTHGHSERMLGQAFKNLGVARKDVVIATKVFNPSGTGPNDRGSSRAHIMDSVEASLERLRIDYIDLYQVHANDPVTPIEETLRAFDDLISRGLVRYIGVSNWSAWRIAKANGIAERRGYARFEAVQAYYSIAGRDIERELMPMLVEEQMGLMVVVASGGRPALGQVWRGINDSWPPRNVRFSSCGHANGAGVHRRHARDCGQTRNKHRQHCARLSPSQTGRHLGRDRSEAARTG
jgi:aryl-alcohol dehydrogenase-like predicted oxidoreductase